MLPTLKRGPSTATLKDLLLLHVVVGRVLDEDDLKDRCGDSLTMANGDQTCTTCKNNKDDIFQVGTGNPDCDLPEIFIFDIKACNGIVHAIDEVILPSDFGRH